MMLYDNKSADKRLFKCWKKYWKKVESGLWIDSKKSILQVWCPDDNFNSMKYL